MSVVNLSIDKKILITINLQYLERKPCQPWLDFMQVLYPGTLDKLEFEVVGFCREMKTGDTGGRPSEQSKNQLDNKLNPSEQKNFLHSFLHIPSISTCRLRSYMQAAMVAMVRNNCRLSMRGCCSVDLFILGQA